ncbi:hypothetical protein DGG96_14540 [Legionella qingyii]|uniref:Uncharacterized protein n=1 Tax=Legionella qingyii TaxID=2184757 RepID=A0A317U0M6_9GAMM|nr:hypothetical protein DGG96_14540 [Legionella qingyii]
MRGTAVLGVHDKGDLCRVSVSVFLKQINKPSSENDVANKKDFTVIRVVVAFNFYITAIVAHRKIKVAALLNYPVSAGVLLI